MRKFFTVSFISALTIGIAYFLPSSVWAEFGGLPAHPLIIHGVIVLLPLIAIFLLAGLFWKNLLRKLHLALIGALAFSVVGVLAAKSSGYSLSTVVGLPKSHAQWGNSLYKSTNLGKTWAKQSTFKGAPGILSVSDQMMLVTVGSDIYTSKNSGRKFQILS